jgi:tripartite-type tricarboxylate transporter receptor subunit TctC
MSLKFGPRCGAAVLSATLLMGATATWAQDFSGQQVTIIVPLAPGGGVDATARLIAPYLEEYLPGNPSVVVENREGGGSLLGAQYFARVAEPDGMTLLLTSASTTFPFVFGMEGADFPLAEMPVAFSYPLGAVVYASTETGVESVADLASPSEALVYGGISATGTDMPILLALDLLGVERNTVLGFAGRGPARLAFERGETNLDFQTFVVYQSQVLPIVEAGAATPLMTPGRPDAEGGLTERDPLMSDLPSVYEAYETLTGQAPDGEIWAAYELSASLTFILGLSAFLPAGTPDEIVAAYSEAIEMMNADTEFVETASQRSGGYLPIAGTDMADAAQRALSPDPATVEFLRTYLAETYDVQF